MSNPTAEQLALLGFVSWHSTDGGSPDVGISIGLGDGRTLWIGEITRDRHADGGANVAALGNDTGWWLILYDKVGAEVLGKFADVETARSFSDLVEELAAAAGRGLGS